MAERKQMAEEIDLNEEEERAIEEAWDAIGEEIRSKKNSRKIVKEDGDKEEDGDA